MPSILSPVNTPSTAPPRRPTNLQTDAVRICIALQSESPLLNPAFLGAATELLSCVATLSPTEFRRHSRKIIRLIETARDTLEASGISLYLFTASSCPKGKWIEAKGVYFDLLRMLQTRRADVDEALTARTNSLLVRLSSNFSGPKTYPGTLTPSPPEIFLPEKWRRALALGITVCTPRPEAPGKSTANACISMPAPDAFPRSAEEYFRCPKRRRQRVPFLVPDMPSPRKRAKPVATDERENRVPSPESYTYKSPPLTKRFGIFCTGKGSMHQHRRVARAS
ncbi:hypothetical protein B0H14DRAFT_2698245 [Mycena olivaceomarginata]|nr:hypothetical protein B0H14DRAFT_2698245 [Mycena olivaceomarginata]